MGTPLKDKRMHSQIVKALRKSDVPGATAFREIRRLREENRKLKALVKDLLLDKTILEEVLRDS
jgi:PII-like signaling protein